jgi:density-regulated protein DRP1
VKFGKDAKSEGVVTVTKLHRGGRKVICQIVGLDYYTKDLKSLASKFGKKFSCGSAVATDDIYGECVSVQGDIEDKLLDFLEQDKDMIALNIPFEKIHFEDKGNKKGRKRA